jgi:hypothetical protein
MTMHPTVTARRDRRGHRGWRTALAIIACVLLPSLASAAGPGAYTARRFDVNATVKEGGHLDVIETITFEFQSGTFQRVWRDIPTSRTDGIDVVEAWMDGNPVTRGDGPGHITVSNRNRIRIEWQFAPTGPSTHTFALRYLARGVAYRNGDRDVVRWRLLPNEHRYKIDESRSTITAAVSPDGTPLVESRRVDGVTNSQAGDEVTLVTRAVSENGWVIAELHYPPGSLVSTAPAWRQTELGAAAAAPGWMLGAFAIFVAAFIALLLARQAYDSPGFVGVDKTTSTEPPDASPAAIAAVLAAKGRASGVESVATLLDLADRGVLTIHEMPKKLGTRQYAVAQVPGKHDLADHEMEALTIAFGGSGDAVSMQKARGRLARAGRRFRAAVNADLTERGLLDPSRKAVRDRLTMVSVSMLLAAVVGATGVAALIPRYQGWPLLLPLALALAGIVGVVMAATTTPLSDTGLMQGARWRGFRRYLKDVADARDERTAMSVPSRWIVYGLALGLGYQWSRYLKKHPHAAPGWFVAGGNENPGSAFAAFVGSHAAGASAGGGGGAAAGGGGSGAG